MKVFIEEEKSKRITDISPLSRKKENVEVFVGKGGELDYFKIQLARQNYSQESTVMVNLGKGSQLRFYTFSLGGKSVKNNLRVIFQGQNAKAQIYGLYLPSEGEAIDNNTFLHHKEPACESFLQYCGILTGNGKAVFEGRILVEKSAQKANAYLENKNFLLGREAQISARPFLEIFADNVKCTHGFSSSQLQKDEISYLQSRGIGLKQAEKLLILAFARRIIDRVDSPALKNDLENLVRRKISAQNR